MIKPFTLFCLVLALAFGGCSNPSGPMNPGPSDPATDPADPAEEEEEEEAEEEEEEEAEEEEEEEEEAEEEEEETTPEEMPETPPADDPAMSFLPDGGTPILRWIKLNSEIEQYACDCDNGGTTDEDCEHTYSETAEFTCHFQWTAHDDADLAEALECETQAMNTFLMCLQTVDDCQDEPVDGAEEPCLKAMVDSLDECEDFMMSNDPLYEEFEEFSWCLDR